MVEQTSIPDGETAKADGEAGGKQESTVKYETYDKAMRSLAKAKEEKRLLEQALAERDQKERELQEMKLKEQGEYKKILEQRELELKSLKERVAEEERQKVISKKLNAFVRNLPGELAHNDMLIHVDVEQIAIDPETGEVDKLTVDKQVSTFVQNYPFGIKTKGGKGLPGDAPKTASNIPYSEWLKLPLKEKKAQLPNLIKP